MLGVRKRYDLFSRITLQAFFAPASLMALVVPPSILQEHLRPAALRRRGPQLSRRYVSFLFRPRPSSRDTGERHGWPLWPLPPTRPDPGGSGGNRWKTTRARRLRRFGTNPVGIRLPKPNACVAQFVLRHNAAGQAVSAFHYPNQGLRRSVCRQGAAIHWLCWKALSRRLLFK